MCVVLKGRLGKKKLYQEINKKKGYGAIPDNIEGVAGADNIAELWRSHYSTLFNYFTNPEVSDVTGHERSHQCIFVTVNDVRTAIRLFNSRAVRVMTGCHRSMQCVLIRSCTSC